MHQALVTCCNTAERSLSRMSTSDPDVTPDLEETEEHETDNDEEDKLTLTKILQKISDCKSLSIAYRISTTVPFSVFHSERTRSEETA